MAPPFGEEKSLLIVYNGREAFSLSFIVIIISGSSSVLKKN
jgi:hypothetical protein